MAPDPHQGGRLEDMAAEGTTIPGDAGKQRLVGVPLNLNYTTLDETKAAMTLRIIVRVLINTFQIPSVPRPDQVNPSADLAHANLAHAADNAFDIPRSVNDRGQTGEVISGTGDQITSNIEKKNLDDANFDPRAKGHDRYAKHARQDNPLGSSKHGAVSHDVDAAPGEEELGQDELLDKRGAR
ncbi:hypothetical protein BKA66DRAFT_545897 [Pyrenochaeta sp. MPI-SDFR-AT-0127]|nr:hypothetical protein BKA66DRAFT_545897 [Pyrenochaeta sp. MPI-SDFR-AT-0127]